MLPTARDILGPAGPIAGLLADAFESRPQQIDLAGAVERVFASRGRLIAEAGTGVGKSFAYLVPAMLRCITTGDRVVIATNTIALQEQLVKKDVPVLAGSIPAWGLDPRTTRQLVPALVKGRGNYVSIRRLKLASQRQDRLFVDAAARRSLHVIEDWATETTDGSLASLPPVERMSVWDRVQSDADNCMGRKCPHFEDCFYQQSRRAMEAANLLICNHAVYFSDLAMRAAGLPGFLPDHQHLVIDEAHAAEDAACDHFGLALTESRVEHFLGVLYHARTRKGYLSQLGIGGSGSLAAAADAAAHATLAALDASRAFFDALLDIARRGDGALLRSGRVLRPGLVENILSPAMKALGLRLRLLREQIRSEPDKFELNAYAIRAEAIAFDADVLTSHSRDGSVYWLETGEAQADADAPAALAGGGDMPERTAFPRGFRGRTRIRLACSPIEVGPALREHLWNRELSIVLTSATLAITADPGRPRADDDPADGRETAPDAPPPASVPTDPPAAELPPVAPAFAHLASRLGCDRAHTLLAGSPFDHARQAEVLVDVSVPDPRGKPARGGRAIGPATLDDYHRALAGRVLHHVRATEGGAFVLFTSFATLRAVAERIEPALAAESLPVLVQGRDGPAGRLVERFREDDRSVLLGAASIWQGVDVKGRGLRNVIIVKLPFDPPDRPIVEARGERIAARGGSPFSEDALPRAILRFKQGFGRLIRSQTDFGRVVVLDARIVSTGYGRRFLAALPPGVTVRRVGDDDAPGPVQPDRHWVPLEE